jgi:hypothetical protein
MDSSWRAAQPGRQTARLRAANLLPIVRAAMTRGEGPPAVVAWVRNQGCPVGEERNWTQADEARALTLADRLAVRLNDHRRGNLGTVVMGETFIPMSGSAAQGG